MGKDIFSCVLSVDVLEVKHLIDAGADVNVYGDNHDTALIHAARLGNAEIVKLLLDAGANVNVYGDNHDTALIHAARLGNAEIVKLLLDAGADVNACGDEYNTALIHAASSGNAEIVKLLLDAGADVNACGDRYNTALIHAARLGNAEIVKLLLDAGADVNACGDRYNTALIHAVKIGNAEIVKLLLDAGADANVCALWNNTALIYAANSGNAEIVKLLLDAGVDVSEENILKALTRSANIEIWNILLNATGNKDVKLETYNDTLINAARLARSSMVKFCIESGADVNVLKDKFKMTDLSNMLLYLDVYSKSDLYMKSIVPLHSPAEVIKTLIEIIETVNILIDAGGHIDEKYDMSSEFVYNYTRDIPDYGQRNMIAKLINELSDILQKHGAKC